MTDVDSPAPLRLPAILQNPGNKALRQVEAFNAQQRERAAARRDAKSAPEEAHKRGKRFVRRMNNAAHVDNPHAVLPKRGDMMPTVPLHYHPLRPSFPSDALERSTHIPSVSAARADPLGASSAHGAFTTSLKGTRAMLRRRGRRAETIVPVLENAVRAWLGGEYDKPPGGDWAPIDPTVVDYSDAATGEGQSGPSRLPRQHQVTDVPELPIVNGKVSAVLELSRSPAHLSWTVPDSFDRLVVHLVARYYELISWSEDQRTATGQVVRLTHIVRPNIVKPKPPPASHALLTPETSDVSGVSGSDTEHLSAESDASDAATEVAHSDTESVIGDDDTRHAGDVSAASQSLSERWADDASDGGAHAHESLTERLGALGLHRTESHGSSAYASSEGGWTDGGVDSIVFHPEERWPESPVAGTASLPQLKGGAPQRLGGNGPLDKPSFFEYLFGE
ncbi:hypothetical protein CC85DRAFT_311187 [Cutaneotrichosporon oleaginosum]|uniref:R3H-associated N-terminal domain-containing protein n=1 Tax=Cutaneotrichosporon oleaginosum TaxID=879819 RepID=A0A0J0XTM1_9TREE|nr:uncharacterized protein CC85DRAFT_311187 [Cutaneotrichosporon oleaginosum]KLT44417.1 hypothetical protein CC85DRAFT_311187 [Cutaneotrichosporon oleaginosum]TXT07863.1 hypothetical protein COLE_04787 [Cutaneotrichosporon oleaginosum]